MTALSRIGPYSVLRPLGAGGMAETFVAERRGPGAFVQRVCLKRIRADLANDPELVRQFMAEAAIAARLRHATIASVLDFGEDQGVLYMAIELIDGVDLRELIKHTPGGLPSALVVYIAVELSTALDVAHGAPSGAVVHRDVSPSNVLVSTEGEVKLADFGIARTEETAAHTRTGIVRGKVPYMAPEYARTARFDARADLFSLGVLLHECAYGVRPFDGATDLETLERATRGERIATPSRTEPLPEGFETILGHLLEADPDHRFATANATLEALLSLPSDARARRDLGVLITAARQPNEASHATESYASTALAAARPDEAAPTRTLASGEAFVPRRRTGPLVALAIAACAVVALLVFWRRAPPEPASAALEAPAGAALPSAPAVANAPPGDPVLRPVDAPQTTAPSPSPDAGATASSESSLAQLFVAVYPWGSVFVNDKAVPAAQWMKLPPGTYNIRAQGPDGVQRSRVQLRAGDHRRIELNF